MSSLAIEILTVMEFWCALVCFLFSLVAHFGTNLYPTAKVRLQYLLTSNGFAIFADCFAYYTVRTFKEGQEINLYLAIFLINVTSMLVTVFFLIYVIEAFRLTGKVEDDPGWLKLALVIFGIDTFLALISRWTGLYYSIAPDGMVIRGPMHFLHLIFQLILIMLPVAIIIKYSDTMSSAISVPLMIVALVPVLECIIYVLMQSGTIVGILSSVNLCFLFISYQYLQSQQLMEMQKQLDNDRDKMMLSQISPHFLYNTLSTIAHIPGNPNETQKALKDFAKYLRGNLSSLSQEDAVPFSKEMEHVRLYTELEHLRFGDGLKFVYGIETEDFDIPALCLQMLVENAVKHGVTMKEDLGTVKVNVRRSGSGEISITVSDDGVGFDTSTLETKTDSVGLKCVRRRMEKIGGSLDIMSIPGSGTIASLTVPEHAGRRSRT